MILLDSVVHESIQFMLDNPNYLLDQLDTIRPNAGFPYRKIDCVGYEDFWE